MILAYFTSNNCRILKNHPNESELAKLPNVVVDPDLSLVSRTPPHFWKLERGRVVPMVESEKKARMHDHLQNGVENRVIVGARVMSARVVPGWVRLAVAAGGGMAVSEIIRALLAQVGS